MAENRPAPERIYFGDNLARLMGVYRLPGQMAADGLGVTRQTVSELTSGTDEGRRPGLDTLYAAARLFEADPDALLRRPFADWAGEYFADPDRMARVQESIQRTLYDTGKYPRLAPPKRRAAKP